MTRRIEPLALIVLALATAVPACALEDELDDDPDADDAEVTAAEASELSIRNPVQKGCADPSVMKDEETYYLTCTGGDGKGNVFPIYASSDLKSWSRVGQVFTERTAPKWADGLNWAPELHHANGKFLAVFSARSKATKRTVIGVAQSSSPTGGYVDRGSPLVSSAKHSAIDAHLSIGDDGKLVLYFKSERSDHGAQADVIRAAPLRNDGMHLAADPKTVLASSLPWEGGVVEAPWVTKRGSYYYLFYSGNFFCNSRYAVGVARSKSPLGPFVKKGAPILKSGSRWVGPGHNTVTVGPDGRRWMLYHAFATKEGTPRCGEHAEDNNRRHTLADRIWFNDGWPHVASSL